MLVKCLLHQEITKERNLKEHQTFDDGDLLQKCKSKDIRILLYTLWTMCHVFGSTIDVDRFFQTEKGNTERESHKYMAVKKRLELFSLSIWMIYMLWLYSLLIKQCGS